MITRPLGPGKTKLLQAKHHSMRDGPISIPRVHECAGFLGHPVVRQRTMARQTRMRPAVDAAIAAVTSDEKTG